MGFTGGACEYSENAGTHRLIRLALWLNKCVVRHCWPWVDGPRTNHAESGTSGSNIKKAVHAYIRNGLPSPSVAVRVPPYKMATGRSHHSYTAGVFSANSPPVPSLTCFRRQPPTFLTTLKANPSFLHSKCLLSDVS